ncbi:MAG: hypothetical protein K2O06_18680 [Acetatifactor sp.]|nr:hypothetical protein [Acetatifactor sp.]
MRKAEAYFTVEAALVIPISISVMLFLVCMFFYQYDRCLMEQDLGMLTLQAAAAMGENSEEIAEKLLSDMKSFSRKRYILWQFTSMDMKMEQGQIEVEASAKLTFPLPEWNLLKSRNVWDASAGYKNTRISPVFFIRQYRKLTGGH